MSQESSNGPQAMTATDNTDTNTGHGTLGAYVTGGAEFKRDTNYIEDRITP